MNRFRSPIRNVILTLCLLFAVNIGSAQTPPKKSAGPKGAVAPNASATKALAVGGPIISATNNDTTAHGDGTSRPGEQIGYTISIGNSGTSAATLL